MAGYVDNERMPEIDFYRIPKYPVWVECIKVWLMFMVPGMMILYASYVRAGGYSQWWYPLLLLLLPIISTVVRRMLKSLILFLLAHIAMGAFVLLAPDLVVLSLSAIFVLGLTVYGFARSVSKEAERDLNSMVLLCVVLVMLAVYVLCVVQGHLEYEWPLMVQGFVFTIVYLSYDHHTSVRDSLKAINKQGTMSTKRVVKFNAGVFAGYMVLGVVVMFGAYFAGLGTVLTKLGGLIMKVIRAIVGFLTSDETVPVDDTQWETVAVESEDDGLVGYVVPETSPFWEFLQHVLVVLFIGLVLYFFIRLMIGFFKSFHATRRYQEADYDEYKSFFSKAKAPKEKRERLSIFDRSPENLIRRAYFRKVRRKIDKEVLRSDTPVQVGDKLSDVKQIVEEYQRVRYGTFGEDSAKV